jgi:hypothetical protein
MINHATRDCVAGSSVNSMRDALWITTPFHLDTARFKDPQNSLTVAISSPNVVLILLSLRFVFTSIILSQKKVLIVARFATRLTCDVLELFLYLFPVHHVPPIGNVFGSLVVVLEIIRVFPNIET